MALISSVDDGVLLIRSVGDQSLEEGLAQLNAGMSLAQQTLDATGVAPDLLIDLTESEEAKSTGELKQIIAYFAAHRPPLSGRIAVVAPKDLLFGLSRVFGAHGERHGLATAVFRTIEEGERHLRAR